MDYLTLIAQQKQDKLALIEDEEEYTYGRLAQEARRLRSKADFSPKLIQNIRGMGYVLEVEDDS